MDQHTEKLQQEYAKIIQEEGRVVDFIYNTLHSEGGTITVSQLNIGVVDFTGIYGTPEKAAAVASLITATSLLRSKLEGNKLILQLKTHLSPLEIAKICGLNGPTPENNNADGNNKKP